MTDERPTRALVLRTCISVDDFGGWPVLSRPGQMTTIETMMAKRLHACKLCTDVPSTYLPIYGTGHDWYIPIHSRV